MIEGVVKTAFKLTPDDTAALQKLLSEMLGGEVSLAEEIDPSLIAGIMIEVGGRVLDNSIKGRLDKVQRELMKRGSVHDA